MTGLGGRLGGSGARVFGASGVNCGNQNEASGLSTALSDDGGSTTAFDSSATTSAVDGASDSLSRRPSLAGRGCVWCRPMADCVLSSSKRMAASRASALARASRSAPRLSASHAYLGVTPHAQYASEGTYLALPLQLGRFRQQVFQYRFTRVDVAGGRYHLSQAHRSNKKIRSGKFDSLGLRQVVAKGRSNRMVAAHPFQVELDGPLRQFTLQLGPLGTLGDARINSHFRRSW